MSVLRRHSIDNNNLNTTRPPRFLGALAPWWWLYLMAMFTLSALTGLAGWMAQRGVRLIWGICVALGLGELLIALGLIWQRGAWRKRVHNWQGGTNHEASPNHRVRRTERGIATTIVGLAFAGVVAVAIGIIGALRTSGRRTV